MNHAPCTESRPVTSIWLAILGATVVICFYSLLKYYFAQDDFVLIERAAYRPADAITRFFRDDAGHFRPLTKGAFFVGMHRLFGLNPAPYHGVCLAVHVANVLLTFRLLRRLRLSTFGAITGAALFGLSGAHFTTLAWISCIQQLSGMFFVLLTLNYGLDAMRTGRRRAAVISAAAYLGALLSIEQAVPAPLILLAVGALGLHAREDNKQTRSWPGTLRWHWALLGAYAFFVFVWKSIPTDGNYAASFGNNIFLNLWTYLARTMHFYFEQPRVENVPDAQLYAANIVFAVILVYHLAMRRPRQAALGVIYFVLMCLPLVQLTNHNYYYHTYLLAFGPVYLIALAFDDLYTRIHRWRPLTCRATLAALLIAGGATSYRVVRTNERMMMYESTPFERNFAIRRAKTAEKIRDAVTAQMRPGVTRVIMSHIVEKTVKDSVWRQRNMVAALGGGAALKLFYNDPKLEILFVFADEEVDPAVVDGADVYINDDLGSCVRLKL